MTFVFSSHPVQLGFRGKKSNRPLKILVRLLDQKIVVIHVKIQSRFGNAIAALD
jgi:hypothetical protein